MARLRRREIDTRKLLNGKVLLTRALRSNGGTFEEKYDFNVVLRPELYHWHSYMYNIYLIQNLQFCILNIDKHLLHY